MTIRSSETATKVQPWHEGLTGCHHHPAGDQMFPVIEGTDTSI